MFEGLWNINSLVNAFLAITFSDMCHPTLCHLKDKKKKYEPPIPTRVGKKKKKTKGPDAASKLPLGKELKRVVMCSICLVACLSVCSC